MVNNYKQFMLGFHFLYSSKQFILGFHLLTTSAVKPVLSKSVTMLEVAAAAAGVCNRRWLDKLSGS